MTLTDAVLLLSVALLVFFVGDLWFDWHDEAEARRTIAAVRARLAELSKGRAA